MLTDFLQNFFTSALSKLNISRYVGSSVKTAHIQDDVLDIVEQCKSQFSILATKNENLGHEFLFGSMLKSEIKEEILNLDVSKASLEINKFPSCMELWHLRKRRVVNPKKATTVLLAFYIIHLKFLKDAYMRKLLNIFKIFYHNISVDSRKDIV